MDAVSFPAIGQVSGSQTATKTTPIEAQNSFQKMLGDALDQVNQSQVESDQATQDFIAGKTDNLHAVMISSEKASITLQATLEIRNKVVEAYQEMMRMQI